MTYKVIKGEQMAKLLACPECDAVMHRVNQVSERSVAAGIDQLARHCFEMHTVHQLEEMLALAWQYRVTNEVDIEQVKYQMSVFCAGCRRLMVVDTPYYVQRGNRMCHCCSPRCQAAASQP